MKPFSWVTGEWEDCSASCGQTGWQRRWVSCQQAHSTGQQQRSVPSGLCGDDRPVGKQACNRLSCPSSWRAGPWTPVRPASNLPTASLASFLFFFGLQHNLFLLHRHNVLLHSTDLFRFNFFHLECTQEMCPTPKYLF